MICHPHPQHGGSKDHPILWAVRNDLAGRRGLATLSFNFRGVMGSAGTYGGGHGEVRDVRSAIGVARERAWDLPTVLCGWSFGANVAVREALDDERVSMLVLIGIPLEPADVTLPDLPSADRLISFRRPVLLLAGDGDRFCPVDRLRAMAASFPTAEVIVIEGTDHFLWRREKEAAGLVGSFVDRTLAGSA